MYQQVEANLCIHPWCSGALFLASAGHLSAVIIRFICKRSVYQRHVIVCRKVQTRRCRQNRHVFHRLKKGLCRCSVISNVSKNEFSKPNFADNANLRGGAGGGAAQVTKRKRSEKALLQGLQTLLESFGDENDEDEADTDQDLLSALKAIIQRAESNPKNLLSELKKLVSNATKRQQEDQNDDTWLTKWQKPRSWADVAAKTAHDSAKPIHTRKPQGHDTGTKNSAARSPAAPKLWSSPENRKHIITANALKKKIEAGEKFDPAILCAVNWETATELRTLAKAHDLVKSERLALVILHGTAPEETESKWVHVQKGSSGPVLQKVPMIPIGEAWPNLPDIAARKVEISNTETETQCLRVTMPFCFSSHNWRQCQSKPANIVAGLLNDHGIQDGLITTYGWRTLESQQWSEYCESVTGFIKIEPRLTESLLKLSGTHGVFFEYLAKERPSTTIEWITQNKEESDIDYFDRVCGSDHTNGFTYRRQGKSRLGMRCPEGTKTSPQSRLRVWEARGMPIKWSTGTITKWLTTNGFEEVELISNPSRNRGWIFRAKNEASAACFAFENSDGDFVTISQFFRQVKKPHQTPIRSAGSSLQQSNLWNSVNGARGARISQTIPVPVTQLDEEEETKEAELPAADNTSGDVNMSDIKRTAESVHSKINSPAKKKAKQPPDSTTEFENFPFCDVGGTGDCAYRALAVAYAFQNKRDIHEAIGAAKNLGATLRAGISSHLKKHKHFETSFAVDPRWTEQLEGGPIPTNYSEWVEATSRPNRWIDGPCLSTAATRLCRNIAIWKWEDTTSQWIKQTVIHPIQGHPKSIEQANVFPPLPLFLKQGHYTTLMPTSKPFPMSWHEGPANTTWDAGNMRGGVKSYSSWLPASSSASSKDVVRSAVLTISKKNASVKAKSHKSWLPASSQGSQSKADRASKDVISGAKNTSTIADGHRKPKSSVVKNHKSWLPSSTRSAACDIANQNKMISFILHLLPKERLELGTLLT